MPVIYLTPAAIGYLTQFILAAAITLYLAGRLRRTARQMQTALLTGFFAAVTLFILLLFFDVALLPDQRLYAVFLQTIAAGLCLIFLLQFAYHFPRPDPRKKWEARIALGFSILYTLWEMQFALFRFAELSAGHVHYRPVDADYALAVGFFWVPIVFIRQAVYADDRRVTWVRKLWQPHGREAQAARTFALVYLSTLALSMVNILRSLMIVSTAIYQLSISVGLLLALFASATVYLNSLPETTSFMVKLAGVMLTTLLTVLGAVGWVMTPAYASTFHPALPDQQTLRFTPNVLGGYDVTAAPFQFDGDLGARLNVIDSDSAPGSAAVDFPFTFFGQTYPQVYAGDNGAVGLGQRVLYQDIQYRYGSTPAILPLYLDLYPEQNRSGVFARQTADRLILTWDHIPNYYRREDVFTFQVTLHSSGVFEICYNGLPANVGFSPDDKPEGSVWLIGAIPGDLAHPPQQVSFADLPLHGEPAGFVQDYYLAFRRELHQLLAPLASLIVISSLLIIAGLPLLLYVSLVQPLNSLLEGVRQVNAGNRAITMPIRFRDEIGFLTDSFNGMIAQLRAHVADLELRVEQRTGDLQAANARLRDEIVEREDAQAQVMGQQRALAALEERERLGRELHDGLGQVMGYVNVQAQAARDYLTSGDDETAAQLLTRLVEIAQEGHDDVRGYILGLKAETAPRQDFFAALEQYRQHLNQAFGFQVTLNLPAELPMTLATTAVETQLLHIIRESLSNARRHAGVVAARLTLTITEDNVQAIIEDDGRGFTHQTSKVLETSQVSRHFGLSVMRERAEEVGGTLSVDSSSGAGTQVVARLPRRLATEGLPPLRILLVDDHPLFLEGLRNLLTARGMQVVGAAHDGIEAQELARALRPDIIAMDIQMPRCDGLEATRRIKAELPDVKIVMLTVSAEEAHLFEALKSGASGYLLKSLSADEFLALLAEVTRGEVVLSPGLAGKVLAEFVHGSNAVHRETDQVSPPSKSQVSSELTPREIEVLRQVAQGLTYKEVGAALFVTEQTIKYHMGEILARLHLQSRREAIAYARRTGLMESGG